MAKIDILLPYWGDFNLLKKTVISVLNQTETDWNLLVFDDHYPSDEASKYFETLDDKRVTYFRHENNIGITNNFNFALGKARSKYCVMLGCDDKLLPNYVKTALMNIGSADFYQPGVQVIDEKDQVFLPLGDRIKKYLQPKKSGIYSGEKLASSLSVGNWLYFPSITWKTKTIKHHGFNSAYKIVEDLVLEMGIIKDGGVLFYDKTVTFQYRRFANSLSSREKSKGGIRFSEEEAVHKYLVEEFNKIGWKRAARAARWRITSRLHKIIS